MTRRSALYRLGASLAALLACPGCLKRAEAAKPAAEPLPHVVLRTGESDPLNPRKGEWFVCPNGHRVAQALKDISEGEASEIAMAKIGNWQTTEPTVGSTPACDHCGENYVMPRGYGWLLITEGHFQRHGWTI